jgi:AMMECR1 domain-containing protein
VGSLTPLGGTLAATLRELAREVTASDPRRSPLRRDELETLRVSVAFTSPPEPVAEPWQVAPMREGLLISSARGSVAFLPGEARTVSWALREARRSGLLERTSDASFQKFSAVIIKDDPVPHEEDAHALPGTP